jgi:hypothetical protein
MKKIIVLCSLLTIIVISAIAQNNSITVAVGDINVSGLKPGDDVSVPVKMVKKSGGKLAVFQIFIDFDHTLLSWKGTWEAPLTGIKNIHKNMPYREDAWLFNDNGSQMVAVWDDPNFTGIDVNDGDVLYEIMFTYKGGLTVGNSSLFKWGDTYEDVDGKLLRGKTEFYDDSSNTFILNTINGSIKN